TYDLDGTASQDTAVAALPNGTSMDRTDVDFGYVGAGSIGTTVWYNADKNGAQSANEPGISGVAVSLSGTSTIPGLGSITASQTTDGSGKYTFKNLPPGNYTVSVAPPGGLAETYDLDGTASSNTATGSLAAGQNRTDFDFG